LAPTRPPATTMLSLTRMRHFNVHSCAELSKCSAVSQATAGRLLQHHLRSLETMQNPGGGESPPRRIPATPLWVARTRAQALPPALEQVLRLESRRQAAVPTVHAPPVTEGGTRCP